MTTIATRLAELIPAARCRDLPPETRTATALHTLDTLGCALAALGLDAVPFVRSCYAERKVTGPSSVVGAEQGLPADMAAMVNGALSHALDFDDTHAGSIVHVTSATAPAALALAEQNGSPGEEVLTAIALGNEVSVRIGRAAGGQFHARGFHPTGVCGIFGAVATAARLTGADAGQAQNAFGIAGSMAGGLLEFLADGSETKPLHPGWAAHAAINAVWLARHGATGPATVFDGHRGFFATYLHGGKADLQSITDGLGTQWHTGEIAYKPYPACHYVHAPLDALAAIVAEHGIVAGEIEEITAFSDDTGIGLVLDPIEDKQIPRTPYDAKFSVPYAFGALLVHGAIGVETFTEQAIGDPAVLALASKVGYERRQYADRPDAFGGGARIRTKDGRTYQNELRYQRGGPENPLTAGDVVAKYAANASVALPEADAGSLQEFVLGLERAADPGPLTILRAARVKQP
jgi:2-methylcitrate dehydratase PrpD